MSGKGTIVVTGATGAIAGAYARELVKKWPEAHLILFCRSISLAKSSLPAQSEHVEYRLLDMRHLDQVRAASEQIAKEVHDGKIPIISTLFLSAGIHHVDADHVTPAGYEEAFAVNHLAHYLLLRLLFPVVDPETGKVIIFGTGGHSADYGGIKSGMFKYVPEYQPLDKWLHPEKPAKKDAEVFGQKQYAESKLAQMMIANELARRLQAENPPSRIKVLIFNPGAVPSRLIRNYGFAQQIVFKLILVSPVITNRLIPGLDVQSMSTVSRTLVNLTTDPAKGDKRHWTAVEPQKDGAMYYNWAGEQIPTCGATNDLQKRETLWNDTATILSLSEDL